MASYEDRLAFGRAFSMQSQRRSLHRELQIGRDRIRSAGCGDCDLIAARCGLIRISSSSSASAATEQATEYGRAQQGKQQASTPAPAREEPNQEQRSEREAGVLQ
jgi:hypothetical protein